jgi:hypothetical protein
MPRRGDRFLIFRIRLAHHCEKRHLCNGENVSKESVSKEKVLWLFQGPKSTAGKVVEFVRDPRNHDCTPALGDIPSSTLDHYFASHAVGSTAALLEDSLYDRITAPLTID